MLYLCTIQICSFLLMVFSCKKIVLLVRICISPLRFFLCTSVSPLILSLWKAALAKIILVLCIYIFLLWYTHVLRISYLYLKLFSYLVNVTHIYYKICIHFPFPPFYFVSIFVFDVHYLPYNILLLINFYAFDNTGLLFNTSKVNILVRFRSLTKDTFPVSRWFFSLLAGLYWKVILIYRYLKLVLWIRIWIQIGSIQLKIGKETRLTEIITVLIKNFLLVLLFLWSFFLQRNYGFFKNHFNRFLNSIL